MTITLSRITQISRTKLGSNYPVPPPVAGIDLSALTLVIDQATASSQDNQFVMDPTLTKLYQIDYFPSPRVLTADLSQAGNISTYGPPYAHALTLPGGYTDLTNSIAFNDTGTKFYVPCKNMNDDIVIVQRELSSAWQLPIVSPTSGADSPVLTDFQGIRSLQFNGTGTAIFYMCSDINDSQYRIRRRPLSVAWDTSTVGAVNQEYNLGTDWPGFPLGLIHACRFNETGTRLYLFHGYSFVSQYNLSTPWDLTSMTYSGVQRDLSTISTMGYVSTGGIWVDSATETIYIAAATSGYAFRFYQFSSQP